MQSISPSIADSQGSRGVPVTTTFFSLSAPLGSFLTSSSPPPSSSRLPPPSLLTLSLLPDQLAPLPLLSLPPPFAASSCRLGSCSIRSGSGEYGLAFAETVQVPYLPTSASLAHFGT
eukprot:1749534-Rhodomonas_salina.1